MGTTVTNKNGIEFDIDALATDVNGKMDKDGVNATCPVVISRTPNNYGGIVEIWSDGYCVQTGYDAANGTGAPNTITLDQPYKDANSYIVIIGKGTRGDDIDNQSVAQCAYHLTANSFIHSGAYNGSSSNLRGCFWRTEGYIR